MWIVALASIVRIVHCKNYCLNFGILPNMLQIIIQLMEGKFPMISRWVIPLNCAGFCKVSLALAGFLKSRLRHFLPVFFPYHCIKYCLNIGIFPNMLQIIIQPMEGIFSMSPRWVISLNCWGFCKVSLALAGFL